MPSTPLKTLRMVSQSSLLSEQTWRQISCCTYARTCFIAPQLISSHETIREHLLLLRAFVFTELCEHNASRKTITCILPPERGWWFKSWFESTSRTLPAVGFTWACQESGRESHFQERLFPSLRKPRYSGRSFSHCLPGHPAPQARSKKGHLVHTPSWVFSASQQAPQSKHCVTGSVPGHKPCRVKPMLWTTFRSNRKNRTKMDLIYFH